MAVRTGQAVLAACSLPIDAPADPPDWFARAGSSDGYRAYWERPELGTVLLGSGVARLVRSDSLTPLADAADLLRADRAAIVADDLTRAVGGPRYLGGFAFDPTQTAPPEWDDFPNGQLVLPRILVQVADGQATLTATVLVEPGADWSVALAATLAELASLQETVPVATQAAQVESIEELPAPDVWKDAVARTAADVRAGRYAKVVLARQQRVHLDGDADLAAALRYLREHYPGAYVFALGTPGGCLLGGTPERLIRLAGQEVATLCLAGTTARGATPEEDARLADELFNSAKNREEHAIVVSAIRDALEPVCDEWLMPDTPQIMQIRNLQHLATPVRARLRGDRCVLDLVARLHPTPAVGGIPRAEALVAIREREGFGRGWYAGAVGWVDGYGGGEFAVALRSALVVPGMAILYGGAGIMGDSNPDSEYAETALKLRPMRAALGVGA
ncbi:MAG: isochorismate synthase [Chloroflexia bacterium]